MSDIAQLRDQVEGLEAALRTCLDEQRHCGPDRFWSLQRQIGDLRHRLYVAKIALLDARIAESESQLAQAHAMPPSPARSHAIWKARISKDALTSERIKLQHEMSPLPVALYG